MKKLTALLLSIVMVLSVTACGSKKLPSDPGELIKVANENMQDIKSLSATANLNLAMTQGEESATVTADMNMDIIKTDDTYKAKIEASINMDELGGTQTATMYMAPEGDKYYVYVGTLGQWMKMEYDMASVLEAEKKVDGDANILGSSAENFTVTDETDDDGNKVKVVSGNMSADTMKEVLAKAFESTETVEGVDETQMQQIKLIVESCLADVPMTYHVDTKSAQITYISMDLSGIAKKALEYASAFIGDSASGMSGLSIDQLDISMKYDNFDKVEDFEIPEEALNAKEIDSTGDVTTETDDVTIEADDITIETDEETDTTEE